MKAFTLPTIFTALDKFSGPVSKMGQKLDKFSKAAATISMNFAIAGAAILTPMALMANEAIKFEDRMADVGKTTGMAGKVLQGLGDDILNLSTLTRTPIEGLQKIAEIGGQMGVKGRENILAFTKSVNEFNVALGSDFQGGVDEATRAIGGLNVLFKETRSLNIADSITKAGSAMNALSAKGVKVPALTDFTNRIGALPDAIKPTIQETMALGAVFNKAGIAAEISSRGLGDILMTASNTKFISKFASQMNLTEASVKNLLNTNPTQFLKQLATSFKGLDAVATANALKKLGIGDVGAIKTIGALSSSLDVLDEYLKISNDEFTKATSLAIEYGTKNETVAAKIARAQNNFQALSITIGSELLPIIGDLMTQFMPVIKGFMSWAKENKTLVKYILIFMGVLGTLLTVLSVITAIAAAVASPFVLIGLAIVALIAFISAMIVYWDKWGAAVSLIMGPLGWIISAIMSFVRNWDMITKAFKEGGVLAGLKAIAKVLLDAVLMPLEQIVSLIAEITGAQWAKDFAKNMHKFRADLGLNVGAQKESEKSMILKQIAPLQSAAEQEREMVEASGVETLQRQHTTLTIDNRTGNKISTQSDNNLIDIKMGSTMQYGY